MRKQLCFYINLYLRSNTFFIVQRRFIFQLYFSNQTKLDFKSINREFLLFRKSLNKQFNQYFIY